MVLQRKSKPRVQRVVFDYSRGDPDRLIGALENSQLLETVTSERLDVNTAWTKSSSPNAVEAILEIF